ncbi:MAG TPA: D-glycero-beta-D-manno-heptose 1-phosphate adenylyltransferase [Longimicrobiales bacterium]|nr:D-glycero-beta-D-manno-heptose 1-phosphate adenylyltransferase [Longimicrobiales bacterium]
MIEPAHRILTRAEASRQFGRPRADTVVFTNGVFDILHRGHVAYLFAARALGDRLIVGVNSDASVQRLKGSGRPLVSAEDRAYTLAGLACVDAVTMFAEDTPAALIEAIVPDVLVKGGDYTADQVVGRDIVELHGGRLVIIPFLAGRSTTSLLQRIRDNDA